jgi:hypothetical protein
MCELSHANQISSNSYHVGEKKQLKQLTGTHWAFQLAYCFDINWLLQSILSPTNLSFFGIKKCEHTNEMVHL